MGGTGPALTDDFVLEERYVCATVYFVQTLRIQQLPLGNGLLVLGTLSPAGSSRKVPLLEPQLLPEKCQKQKKKLVFCAVQSLAFALAASRITRVVHLPNPAQHSFIDNL